MYTLHSLFLTVIATEMLSLLLVMMIPKYNREEKAGKKDIYTGDSFLSLSPGEVNNKGEMKCREWWLNDFT